MKSSIPFASSPRIALILPFRFVFLAAAFTLLLACGGVSQAAPQGTTGESSVGASTPPTEASVTEQAATLDECPTVVAAYSDLMEEQTVCTLDEDCHVLAGDCAVGLGGCYYAVSVAITDAVKRPLVDRFQDLSCTGGVCRCMAPPESASCVEGVCELDL